MNVDEMLKEGQDVSRETSDSGENVSRETLEPRGLSFFKVKSLDKSLSEYMNHVLNKNADEDIAQGLRGVDAYIGNTDLAFLDLFGFVKYFLKKKKAKAKEVQE